jgi:L-aspartate oxidase
MEAGDGISNPDAVKIVAYDGPGWVEDFLVKKVGVPFSRSGEDEFEFAREASHSRRRILHSKDSTGKAIETALIAKAAEYSNIRTYPGYPAIDLLTIPHHSTSPIALYRETSVYRRLCPQQRDRPRGKVLRLLHGARHRGLGRIYLHTTNPP